MVWDALGRTLGGSGGALGEFWEALYIKKLPINRPCGRYVINGYPWIFVDVHGYPWISMDINGYPWISMDNPWISIDYLLISMDNQ